MIAQADEKSGIIPLRARVAIVAIALLLLTRNVTGWFNALHDWNSAMYSVFARNHVTHGLGYTKLLFTWSHNDVPVDRPVHYLNHPPLTAVWAAIPMLVFGDQEWVGRTMPIAATLGSVWLLMAIVSRLQSPTLGLLTGLFYATFPITAYFGRMLDQMPFVQFFSLLMLHGYLQWTGVYGKDHRRNVGPAYYVFGCVLGIGTGWATVILAGLIWLWQLRRMLTDNRSWAIMLWVTAIPAASLLAVLLHILWACNWDVGMLGPLVYSRSLGPLGENQVTWSAWSHRNAVYLLNNVSPLGAVAAVIYLVGLPIVLQRSTSKSPLRDIVRSRRSVVPVLLIGLQGVVYLVAFRNRSWVHEYWQFHAIPFVAVAMASVVLASYRLISRRAPRVAGCVAALLVMLPMPFFARTLDLYHQERLEPLKPGAIAAFRELAQLVPAGAPVMVSSTYPYYKESFGSGYTNIYPIPQVAYYANRPVIQTTDFGMITANPKGCTAYILELTDDPGVRQLAQRLSARYEGIPVMQRYVIFLLNRPKR